MDWCFESAAASGGALTEVVALSQSEQEPMLRLFEVLEDLCGVSEQQELRERQRLEKCFDEYPVTSDGLSFAADHCFASSRHAVVAEVPHCGSVYLFSSPSSSTPSFAPDAVPQGSGSGHDSCEESRSPDPQVWQSTRLWPRQAWMNTDQILLPQRTDYDQPRYLQMPYSPCFCCLFLDPSNASSRSVRRVMRLICELTLL